VPLFWGHVKLRRGSAVILRLLNVSHGTELPGTSDALKVFYSAPHPGAAWAHALAPLCSRACRHGSLPLTARMLFPTRARKAVLSRSLSIRSLLRWPSYFTSGQTPPTKFISTCGSGTLSGSNRLEPLADELRPAFNEPWQAEAYALVQVLIETGRISSSQWAKAFGAALREAAGQGEPDSSDTYYPPARSGSWRARARRRDSTADRRLASAPARLHIGTWAESAKGRSRAKDEN
jgi:hypothetical protein